MKKYYNKPAVSVEEATETVSILACSGVKSDIGIGYGGVDGSGDETPSVKEWEDVWD